MVTPRTTARRFAVQALYQWQLAGQSLRDIEVQFIADNELGDDEASYFAELLHEIPKRLDELDGRLAPLLSRPIEQVDPVERAILRVGSYELAHRLDVPYRVVINEAIELAKRFGAEKSHRFINGVLDRLAKDLRKAEIRKVTAKRKRKRG